MDIMSILRTIWGAVNTTLFEIGGRPVSVATMITGLVIMGLTLFLAKMARRAIRRAYELRGIKDEGHVGVVTYLTNIIVLLAGFGVAIEVVGIDLSALFAAGAVFAVAIGLSVQSIIQNFVSGVILLGERTIKPGDVLDVGGQVVKVRQISLRATIVRTLNDEDLIVPNGSLVQSTVKNYTHNDTLYRLRVPVGVVYASDMSIVQETLETMAEKIEWRNQKKKPIVLMTGFGDNSVNFEVSVWIDDPWTLRRKSSDLHHEIWKAFKEKNIIIAFPQLDVHFDPPVIEALTQKVA